MTTRTTTFNLIANLIEAGRYEYNDMVTKLDVFLLCNRITAEEYEIGMKMLNDRLPKDEEPTEEVTQ